MKAAAGSETQLSSPRELGAERDVPGGAYPGSTHAHTAAPPVFPRPFSSRQARAPRDLWGGLLKLGPGGDTLGAAGDITGPPSPPAPDWLRWLLTLAALPRLLLVFKLTVFFSLAENKRWRRLAFSAPWRYCCCPVSPAAQVAAWPEFFLASLLTHDWWCVGEDGCGQSGVWAFSLREAGGLRVAAAEATTLRAPHVHLAAELLEETA